MMTMKKMMMMMILGMAFTIPSRGSFLSNLISLACKRHYLSCGLLFVVGQYNNIAHLSTHSSLQEILFHLNMLMVTEVINGEFAQIEESCSNSHAGYSFNIVVGAMKRAKERLP